MGKYKSGHASGETRPLYNILLVLQLFWESTYSCHVSPHPPEGRRAQQGGKHWKVLPECWSLREAPSAMSRPQLPRVGCYPEAGEISIGGCAMKQWRVRLQACSGRGLPPYPHPHERTATTAVAPVCLGSSKEPVHHQLESTAF